MDLIKLSSTTANPTELSVGNPIVGYTKALWVEKYRSPGEFKIEGYLSSGLRDLLPIDSFITHVDTETVMIVESHEIKQPKDTDPKITISGRCFTAFLEERTPGDFLNAFTTQIVEYIIPADPTWEQVVNLIDAHLINPLDSDDGLIGVEVDHTCTGSSTSEDRTIRQAGNNCYVAAVDIMKVDDLGLKSVRPTASVSSTYFRVYRGENVSKKVRFSWTRGDLENVEYFFSNKKYKTQVRVIGRWVNVIVNDIGADNYDRRTTTIDASDIDEQASAYPSGGALFLVETAMSIRGRQALKAQRRVSITQADVSENTTFRFRQDYNIGDLVTVDGDFGESTVMRVIEYAEADDENGSTGHPTLAIPGEY